MKLLSCRITIALSLIIPFCLTNSACASDRHIDVSQIIPKTEAESILGEKVKNPTPRNGQGKDGYYSKCNYYTENHGKSLLLRVYQPGSGAVGPQRELELVAADSTRPMKPVEGLGDKAQMFSGGGGTASRVLMVYIAKGNAFVTIGLSGMDDESSALAKAREVANKILAKL
jgi:hypothetical protein